MKNFSTSIQRRKRGKRTAYFARLTYYDKTGKRKGVSKSAATHWEAKRELQNLIDQHVAGGSDVLEARHMTFAALAEHCKETRYCEAFYDEQGRKLYGVREPKKFASIINRLVSSLGHLKLNDITVSHLQQYRRKRLSTKTNRGAFRFAMRASAHFFSGPRAKTKSQQNIKTSRTIFLLPGFGHKPPRSLVNQYSLIPFASSSKTKAFGDPSAAMRDRIGRPTLFMATNLFQSRAQ